MCVRIWTCVQGMESTRGVAGLYGGGLCSLAFEPNGNPAVPGLTEDTLVVVLAAV